MVAATSEGLERVSAERRARWLRQRRRRRVFWLVVSVALLAGLAALLWPGGGKSLSARLAEQAAAPVRRMPVRPLPGPTSSLRGLRAALPAGPGRDARESREPHDRADVRRRALGPHAGHPARAREPPRPRHVLRGRARDARHGAGAPPHRRHGQRAGRPHLQPRRPDGAARAGAQAPAAVDARARGAGDRRAAALLPASLRRHGAGSQSSGAQPRADPRAVVGRQPRLATARHESDRAARAREHPARRDRAHARRRRRPA